jgi:hypothetical protein
MAGTMDRRLILTALACWPARHVLAQEEGPRPRHKVSAAEMYEALSARFPVRLGLAGLLELQLSAPQLLLRPARNQLGATLAGEVSGLQVPRMPPGELDVVFALRYEAADQTVRAHHPEFLDLRWPGLPPETLQALQSLLPTLARRMGEVVLHRVTPRERALADTMGFEPEKLEVVEDGVVIWFGPKQRR